MIDKEELVMRIEDSLTTRMVKELFKSIVEQCKDTPMPKYKWHEEGKENECEEWYRNGWNACIDAMKGEEREEHDE